MSIFALIYRGSRFSKVPSEDDFPRDWPDLFFSYRREILVFCHTTARVRIED